MEGDTSTIIGTGVTVGVALAMLIMRSTARIDADRRAADAQHDADRRAVEDRFDRAIAEWRSAMADFRAEMQRLAERQSHVEGRLDERSAAAD